MDERTVPHRYPTLEVDPNPTALASPPSPDPDAAELHLNYTDRMRVLAETSRTELRAINRNTLKLLVIEETREVARAFRERVLWGFAGLGVVLVAAACLIGFLAAAILIAHYVR